MKKIKLFSKTFLYIMTLLLGVVLVCHALTYFLMPVVYTNTKENALRSEADEMVRIMQTLDPSEYQTVINQFRGTGIGHFSLELENAIFETAVSLTPDGSGSYQSSSAIHTQDEGEPPNIVPTEPAFEKNEDYVQIGIPFTTITGSPAYLRATSTLQPVSEAKNVSLALMPYTILISIVLSALFALIYSRKITRPIAGISAITKRMREMDSLAICPVQSQDEIGLLSENINALYESLLATINDLKREMEHVDEIQRSRLDFMLSAAHELKTPVTAVSVSLENMILGVGKYKDHDTYLPLCKEEIDRLGNMIREILSVSKLSLTGNEEAIKETPLGELVQKAAGPYFIIAKSKGVHFEVDIPESASVTVPISQFEKALSNIISNATRYTSSGGVVKVYYEDGRLMVYNECEPIPSAELNNLFEPFSRMELSRNREGGGNGLGLYIVAQILSACQIEYAFEPFLDGMRFSIRI